LLDVGHQFGPLFLPRAIQKPWNGIGWDISMLLFVAGFIWLIELMKHGMKMALCIGKNGEHFDQRKP